MKKKKADTRPKVERDAEHVKYLAQQVIELFQGEKCGIIKCALQEVLKQLDEVCVVT